MLWITANFNSTALNIRVFIKDHLIIPLTAHTFADTQIDEVSDFLNVAPKNSIACQPWDDKYTGSASFSIAYSIDSVLLKFFIVEESILAKYIEPNDPVFKDSCVEFFIALDNDDKYYNFEFNCKGNCLVGYGIGKEQRELIPISLIRSIKTAASFKSVKVNDKPMIEWGLTIVIPNVAFYCHQKLLLNNRAVRSSGKVGCSEYHGHNKAPGTGHWGSKWQQ